MEAMEEAMAMVICLMISRVTYLDLWSYQRIPIVANFTVGITLGDICRNR